MSKEEKAKEYRLKTVLNTERYLEGGSNIEKAYIAGWDAACSEVGGEKYNCGKILNLRRKAYAKGKEDFLNKACEFLKSYRRDYPDGTGYVAGIIDDETIEDFKKYMED